MKSQSIINWSKFIAPVLITVSIYFIVNKTYETDPPKISGASLSAKELKQLSENKSSTQQSAISDSIESNENLIYDEKIVEIGDYISTELSYDVIMTKDEKAISIGEYIDVESNLTYDNSNYEETINIGKNIDVDFQGNEIIETSSDEINIGEILPPPNQDNMLIDYSNENKVTIIGKVMDIENHN